MAPHDPDLVPKGPAADWFYSGKDGTPLTDEQYDEMKQRWVDSGSPLPWDQQKEES